MYVVELLQEPKLNDFRPDFFPRKFRYIKDAKVLVAEVKAKGGVAVIRYEK